MREEGKNREKHAAYHSKSVKKYTIFAALYLQIEFSLHVGEWVLYFVSHWNGDSFTTNW